MKKLFLLYSFDMKSEDYTAYIVEAMIDRKGDIISAKGKAINEFKQIKSRNYFLDDNTNAFYLESIGQDKKDLENFRDMNLELKGMNIEEDYFIQLLGGIKFFKK